MIRISKSVLAVSGAVLAAGLIGFTNPKTVHAVAAALVEITNTSANPVPNAEVTIASSQLVYVSCASNFCLPLGPGGTAPDNGENYTVPSGETLVITDVDVVSPSGSGIAYFGLVSSIPGGLAFFDNVPSDGLNHHVSFGRGIPIPAGTTIFPQQSADTAGISAYLHGYLTSN